MSHRIFVACVPLLLALAPASAAAEPDRVPWYESPDVHVDLRAYSDHNPPELPVVDVPRPPRQAPKVVYVNFDGASMNGGCGDNPQNNCSTIFTGVVEPFAGDASLRAAVVQWVRERSAPYNIRYTDERPSSGDYDMEMMGEWEGVDNGTRAGTAPSIDCDDIRGGEVSFAMKFGNTEAVAEVILQEIAHTWGLAHVNDQSDLLFPTTAGVRKWFQDECFQIVADTQLTPTASNCPHHQQACGSNSLQNSHQELLLTFGPGTPDSTAPSATIVSPSEGEAFPSGAAIDLTVAFDDNESPMMFTTRLIVESSSLPMTIDTIDDYPGPAEYTFPLTGLPDGEYAVTVEVSDETSNMAPNLTVNFSVGGPGGTTTDNSSGGGTTGDPSSSGSGSDTTTDGSGGDTDGSGGTAGQTGGTDPGSATTGPGMTPEEESCACKATGSGSAAWALLPLVAGFLRRRRT